MRYEDLLKYSHPKNPDPQPANDEDTWSGEAGAFAGRLFTGLEDIAGLGLKSVGQLLKGRAEREEQAYGELTKAIYDAAGRGDEMPQPSGDTSLIPRLAGEAASQLGEYYANRAHSPEREKAFRDNSKWKEQDLLDIITSPSKAADYVTDPAGLWNDLPYGLGNALGFVAATRAMPESAAVGAAGKVLTPTSGLLGRMGANRAAKALGSDTAKNLLGTSMQFGTTMAPFGAMVNAGTLIDPLKEQGKSDAEIADAMGRLFAEEIPYDVAFAALTGNVAKGQLGRLAGRNSSTTKKILANALGVPLEGAGGYLSNLEQMILSEKHSNQPYGELFGEHTEAEKEAGRMGAVAGLPFSVMGVHSGVRDARANDKAYAKAQGWLKDAIKETERRTREAPEIARQAYRDAADERIYWGNGGKDEGKTWARQHDGVSFNGAQPKLMDAIDALADWFYKKSGGKRLIVTSAVDGRHPSNGSEHGHDVGWKVDINDWDGESDGYIVNADGTKGSLADELIAYGQSLGLGMNWEGDHIDVALDGTQWDGNGEDAGGFRGGGRQDARTEQEPHSKKPSGIDTFMRAIVQQESGGDYDLTNQDSGAAGAFQIMPENWSAWAQDAGLPADAPMTPENQNLVARSKMLEYYNKFGNWRDVAIAWYGGEGAVSYSEEAKARPQYSNGQEYPSINEYADSVMSHFENFGGEQAEQERSVQSRADELFKQRFQDRMNPSQQQQRIPEPEPIKTRYIDTRAEDDATQKLFDQFAQDRLAKAVESKNVDENSFWSRMFNDDDTFNNTKENRDAIRERYGEDLTQFIAKTFDAAEKPQERPAQPQQGKPQPKQTQQPAANNKANALLRNNDVIQAGNKFLEELRSTGKQENAGTAFKLQAATQQGDVATIKDILKASGREELIQQAQQESQTQSQPQQTQEEPVKQNTTPENALPQEQQQETAKPAKPKATKLERAANLAATPIKTGRSNLNSRIRKGNAMLFVADENGIEVSAEDRKALSKGNAKELHEWQLKLASRNLIPAPKRAQTQPTQPTQQEQAQKEQAQPEQEKQPSLIERARRIIQEAETQKQAEVAQAREQWEGIKQGYKERGEPLRQQKEAEERLKRQAETLERMEREEEARRIEREERERQAKQAKELSELQTRQAEEKRNAEERQRQDAEREAEYARRESLPNDISNALAPASSNNVALQKQGNAIADLVSSKPFQDMYGTIQLPNGLEQSLRRGDKDAIETTQQLMQRQNVRPVEWTAPDNPEPIEPLDVKENEPPQQAAPQGEGGHVSLGRTLLDLVNSEPFKKEFGDFTLPRDSNDTPRRSEGEGAQRPTGTVDPSQTTAKIAVSPVIWSTFDNQKPTKSEVDTSKDTTETTEPKPETKSEPKAEEKPQEEPSREESKPTAKAKPEEKAQGKEEHKPQEESKPKEEPKQEAERSAIAKEKKKLADTLKQRLLERTPLDKYPETKKLQFGHIDEQANNADESVSEFKEWCKRYLEIFPTEEKWFQQIERAQTGGAKSPKPKEPPKSKEQKQTEVEKKVHKQAAELKKLLTEYLSLDKYPHFKAATFDLIDRTVAFTIRQGNASKFGGWCKRYMASTRELVKEKGGIGSKELERYCEQQERFTVETEQKKAHEAQEKERKQADLEATYDRVKELLAQAEEELSNKQKPKEDVAPKETTEAKQDEATKKTQTEEGKPAEKDNAKDTESGQTEEEVTKPKAKEKTEPKLTPKQEKTATGLCAKLGVKADKHPHLKALIDQVAIGLESANEQTAKQAKLDKYHIGIRKGKITEAQLDTMETTAATGKSLSDIFAELSQTKAEATKETKRTKDDASHIEKAKALFNEWKRRVSSKRKEIQDFNAGIESILNDPNLSGEEIRDKVANELGNWVYQLRGVVGLSRKDAQFAKEIKDRGLTVEADGTVSFSRLSTLKKTVKWLDDNNFEFDEYGSAFSAEDGASKDIINLIEDDAKLTPRQKLLKDFAAKLGVPIQFFDNPDGRFHGAFVDGITFLNVNSKKGLDGIFWHESFHWLKANNPELYAKLVEAAGITDAQRKAYLERTGRNDLTTDEAIDEEILADQMDDVAKRTGLLQNLAGKNRGVVERVVQWLKDTMNKFIDMFRNPQGRLTTAQAKTLADQFAKIARDIKDADGKPIFRVNNRTGDIEVVEGRKARELSKEEIEAAAKSPNAKYSVSDTIKNFASTVFNGKPQSKNHKQFIVDKLEELTRYKTYFNTNAKNEADVIVDSFQKIIRARHAYEFEKLLPATGEPIAKVLGLTPSDKLSDCIANWMMTGVLNPSPEATAFQKAMRAHPAEAELLQSIRDTFQEMANMSAEEAVESNIVRDKKSKTFREWLGEKFSKEEWVDDLHPIVQAYDQVLAKAPPAVADIIKKNFDPYMSASLFRGKGAIADMMIGDKKEVTDEDVDITRRVLQHEFPNVDCSSFTPLAAIAKMVDYDVEGLERYALAKLDKEMHEKKNSGDAKYADLTPSYTEAQCDEIINAGKAKYDAAQRALVDYSNTLAAIQYSTGVISANQFYQRVNGWENFVPTARVFEEFEDISVDKSDSSKHKTGSKRRVYAPLGKLEDNTNLFIRQALQNRVRLEIVTMARFGNFGDIFAETPKGYPHGHTIHFKENGKMKYLVTPDESLVRAVESIQTPADANIVVQAFKTAGMVMRGLYTMFNAEFMVGNPFRDLADAFIHNKYGSRNPFVAIPAMVSAAVSGLAQSVGAKIKTEEFRTFLAEGGAQSGFSYEVTEGASRRVNSFGKKSLAKSTWDKFLMIAEASENMTRFSTFKTAKDNLAKQHGGVPTPHDLKLAAMQARRATVDFARAGRTMRGVNKVALFSNAAMQSLALWGEKINAFRKGKEGAGKELFAAVFKTIMNGVMPALALAALNFSDDDRRKRFEQRPVWEKDTYWIFGDGLRVPKGMDLGIKLTSALTEEFAMWLASNKPVEWKRIANNIGRGLPSITTTIFTPAVESYMNYSIFKDAPIVPYGQQDDPKYKQYGKNTSWVAKQLGNMFNQSPRQIDHLIAGYGGSMFTALTGGSDGIPIVRRFMFDPDKNPRIVQDYYKTLEEQEEMLAEYKARRTDGEKVELPEDYDRGLHARLKKSREAMTKISKAEMRIMNDPKLDADKRKEKLRELEKRRVALCERVLGKAR